MWCDVQDNLQAKLLEQVDKDAVKWSLLKQVLKVCQRAERRGYKLERRY